MKCDTFSLINLCIHVRCSLAFYVVWQLLSQSLLSNYLTIKIVNEHLRPDFIAPDLPAKLSQTVICVIPFVKIHINWLNKIKLNGFTSYFVIVSRRVCVLTYFVYFIVHNLNLAMKWLMIPSQSIWYFFAGFYDFWYGIRNFHP